MASGKFELCFVKFADVNTQDVGSTITPKNFSQSHGCLSGWVREASPGDVHEQVSSRHPRILYIHASRLIDLSLLYCIYMPRD